MRTTEPLRLHYQKFIRMQQLSDTIEPLSGLIQENSCRPAGRDGAPISNRLGSATGGSVKQSRLEAGAPFS